jgi:hypothetical protein
MYQAIETKYYGPTNCKGSRIRAVSGSGDHRIFKPYDHSLNASGNHEAAAPALAEKLDWLKTGEYAMGATREGYVMVFLDRHPTT